MAIKQDFTRQVEGQVAVWQAQIKDYQERLAQAGSMARSDYERGLSTLRENAERASQLLGKVREANEAAWTDMQSASQRALAQLQQGWADALKRFQ